MQVQGCPGFTVEPDNRHAPRRRSADPPRSPAAEKVPSSTQPCEPLRETPAPSAWARTGPTPHYPSPPATYPHPLTLTTRHHRDLAYPPSDTTFEGFAITSRGHLFRPRVWLSSTWIV